MFFHQNLGDFQTFVDGIYSKIMRDFQYQSEEIRDWTAYLKYVQSIFLEFVIKAAPNRDNLIYHFWKGLKPSICSQIEQIYKELKIWDVLIQKTIAKEPETRL